MLELPVTSECPRCGRQRLQVHFNFEELVGLLRTGAAFRPYCSTCDEHWELSVTERGEIARELNK